MRLLLLSVFLLFGIYSFSQKKDFSIGIQTPFPTKGISLKYDLDSVNQYELSYTLFKDYSLNRNLYGWKYSRKLNKFKYFESFTYVGLMVMTYKQSYLPSNSGLDEKGSTFSYGIGFGIKNTLFHRITLSLEGGVGKYNFNKPTEDFSFVSGFGLHYHFKRKE